MKRGFTLIELLAVIVILAIIAVIATPIVLNIIKDAKKSASLRSAENYIHSLELSLTNNQLTSSNLSDGVYSIDEIDVEIDGKRPSQGYVQIEKGNIVKYNVKIDNQEVDSVEDYDIWKEVNGSGELTEVIPDGNTYHITKASELAWVAQVVNDGTNLFDGKLISLEANLDLNNIEWTPIGNTSSTSFKGVFNGNNHVIKGLKIYDINSDSGKGKGLFGCIMTGSVIIKNLIIVDSNVTNYANGSILVAILKSPNAIVENIYAYNNKLQSTGNAGIIVARNFGTINNCKSISDQVIGVDTQDIKSTQLGAIVGVMSQGLIDNCYSNSYIMGSDRIGGIVGFTYSTTYDKLIISNSVSYSTIIGINTSVGGIVGQLASPFYIDNVTSYSNIEGGSWVGGITGQTGGQYDDQEGIIINSASYSNIKINVKIGGGLIGNHKKTIINCIDASVISYSNGVETVGALSGATYYSTINGVELSTIINGVKVNENNIIGEKTGDLNMSGVAIK